MKSKALLLLLAASLLVWAAWQVRVTSIQADDVPEKYQETVRKGLEYLVENQFRDGHWEGDRGQHPVAMTGLAGLALLMESGGPFDGRRARGGETKYAANIGRAALWLTSQSGPDGLIYSKHASETTRYMQGHALAATFLAGVCELEPDRTRRERLTGVLTRAVKYIVKAQSSQGGWHDTSKAEGHDFDSVAATALQIQALQGAENAGISVPHESLNDAQQYMKAALTKNAAAAKAGQPRLKAVDAAAALACLHGRIDRDKEWQAEIPMGSDIKFGRDELTHYYYAQVLGNLTGPLRANQDAWTAYRAAMFDHLQSSQRQDGSWPPGDGIGVGPVYSTAVWCIILQLGPERHPSAPRRGREIT